MTKVIVDVIIIILWSYMGVNYIWGDFAEKSYYFYFRMKWLNLLLPGRWADKEYFIRSTKCIFYIIYPLGILFCLIDLLGKPKY